MVKKGQRVVSKMASDKQGQPRDPDGPEPKSKGDGSYNGRRWRGQSEGAGSR